ncbi:uncharacterized protein LOC107761651 [Nicotiana tabacum]|uniref:2-hydroxy-6-oxononadienedioate/2-hydroxy-6- oxononatrienedioate hydrolase n=2 Tax=Nicotiana TaxID=4085 RepID=A0A1S3X6P1_TOBAC|nr:PREDICTED: epoxide hydrolase 4-like [Nicotiana sylvestris]XP_016435383.1 PREDICTED: 2-hydroxy-6-oxononadienedioate/2-hydroxy-6-oxononatrienedioate hydrolase-like [Nicotiana tabacum]
METLRLCFYNLLSFYLSVFATILRWILTPLPSIKRFPIFFPFIDAYISLLFRFSNLSPCTLDLDEQTTVHFWAPNHRHFNKPNLVLIHGYGGDAKWQFMYQVKSLAQSFNLYIPDLLFFGKSYTTRPERTEEFQAKCVVEGLKGLGVKKCSMFSISYGGFVGYKMAEMYPELVEKVVILSSGVGCTKEQKEEQLKRIGRDPVELLIPAKPEDLHVLVNMSIYKYNPFKWAPDAFLQEFIDVMCRSYLKEKQELVYHLLSDHTDCILPILTQETMLIWGDKDRVFPLMFGQQLQRHLGPRAKLEIIKNTGHAANIESPDSVNALIKAFILQSNQEEDHVKFT